MISISNIAWGVSLDKDVSELMINKGVSYIDIAPLKYFKKTNKIAIFSKIKRLKSYYIKLIFFFFSNTNPKIIIVLEYF